MALTSVNPVNGQEIHRYETLSEDHALSLADRSYDAFKQWRETDFGIRKPLLKRTAALLRERSERYGRLITEEMGKTYESAKAEVEKCALVCDYYANNGQRFLFKEPIETEASASFITYNPLGPVLAVMPWNFPFWQVFRFAAPALMAGNTILLKHASNVPGCSIAIEELVTDAGFSEGVFQSLLIETALTEKILAHNRVMAVTLTGSGPAGKAVASAAGRLLKKSVLELGGSDPYVILDDADIDLAAKTCVAGRLINGGQSCIAAKRFIVVENVLKPFQELFLHYMEKARMGDPFDERVTFGPMAKENLRDELHEQVQKSIASGANLLTGGTIPAQKGAWYPATVLAEVKPGMPAFDEELFGPVAAIIPAKNEDEAIMLANKSDFGLGAAVFTQDKKKGERIAAEKLEAGCCFVNDVVKSDPRLPFGGIKTSGYGRELSYYGIREFSNVKTVYVK